MTKQKKPYQRPRVSILGKVTDVTHALFWTGSGDFLSGFIQQAEGTGDPWDGGGSCFPHICTGS